MSKNEAPQHARKPEAGALRKAGLLKPVVTAGPGELVGYFGYGSLVNRATLRTEVIAAVPARLAGWRRTWRPRPDMGPTPGVVLPDGLTPSLLTAHRAPGAAIDGMLVIDRAENLGAIDAREFRYHRRDISLAELEFHGGGSLDAAGIPREINLHVYEARIEHPQCAGPSPILRSYLDAVMQGFYREFGADGVHRFVTETDAFHHPIHEDRHAPLYPRAVTLTAGETELFDLVLGRRAHGPGG
ncbi:gamma-glutamylcyclotransferase family protein [Hoeflea sp.]|uniref:gamma-glutamylcyclotransferase family protein n=1 Tax=Hoeflea sp. TaxID=1940281 RepID=UPI003A91E4C1